MTTNEDAILKRTKFIGDGEFILLGTPAELIQELKQVQSERERLARIDEVQRVDASGWTTRELEGILGERLSELQKQSSSQEDHGAS